MPFTTEQLRQILSTQTWTAHNIRLNGDVSTVPGQYQFEQDGRLLAIFRTLRLLYPDGLAGVRAADLGSLEGGFALELARAGARVTGYEARRLNMHKLKLIEDHFALTNLDFVQADVKEFGLGGAAAFDVVLALGILYHLDRPADWLAQIAPVVKRVLILDTHFAPALDSDLPRIDPRLANLSALEEQNAGGAAYPGRWFHEFGEDSDREAQLWASYSNSRSFWLTKEALLRAVIAAGFELVFEQHDYSGHRYEFFTHTFPRTLLVAIKL